MGNALVRGFLRSSRFHNLCHSLVNKNSGHNSSAPGSPQGRLAFEALYNFLLEGKISESATLCDRDNIGSRGNIREDRCCIGLFDNFEAQGLSITVQVNFVPDCGYSTFNVSGTS